MNAEFILIYVTAGSEDEARSLARSLVADRLAGCVSLAPIASVYRWDDTVQIDSEWQLAIKTRREQFEAVRAAIAALHSYDVPECLAVPIVAGAPNYLQWLHDVTA